MVKIANEELKVEKIDDDKFANDIEKYPFAYINYAANMTRQALMQLDSSQNTRKSVSFSSVTKENLISYLKSPSSNEKNIRNASIHMYNISTHYRRLVQYYAYMSLWQYIIAPLKYDPTKLKMEAFKKQYFKVSGIVENMNLKHEMRKATLIAMREGILYGVILSDNDSFFIQRVDPDICEVSSVTDGVYNYVVDFSKIKEDELYKYPEEFTTLWNQYKKDGIGKKEIPEAISFCLKSDVTTSSYSLPLWASTLPLIYDIENYKELQETATEISNYKLLAMQIPSDSDGNPTMDFEIAKKYYNHLALNLPPYVGAAMSPMKLEAFDFNKSNAGADANSVNTATQNFFADSGTSPLLFGDATNNTSSALKLSIRADEAIVFEIMAQCERLINRYLKNISGTIKFKINFLPITIFNQDEQTSLYKDASMYGLPVKSAYAAALGIHPTDVMGMNTIEMDILDMGNLTPMSSSYTQSGNDAGRPTNESKGKDVTESGETTTNTDANSNR